MKKHRLLFFSLPLAAVLIGALFLPASKAETQDEAMMKKIYTSALTEGRCYQRLHYLCKNIGHRLSGSAAAQLAVDWTKSEMEKLSIDKVWLQDVLVPHWVRGEKETAGFQDRTGKMTVPIIALGGSVGTGKKGITAEVIEVQSLEEVAKLGEAKIKGKIVFYNRPMDPNQISCFSAYGGAVDQRGRGAIEASKYGAVGVVVRSMTLKDDDYPHTGAMRYEDGVTKIPACAISTNGANELSRRLKADPALKFSMKMSCEMLEDVPSANVIGEIRGSEFPDEIILIGGHLDSWDVGEGAHDDGAGTMQSIEVLDLLKRVGYQPKRTIRAVMFMNEENGLRGGKKYAEEALAKNEKHIAAIESDAGGFSPRGFGMSGDSLSIAKVATWLPLYEPFLLHFLREGGGGADIGPLKDQGCLLLGLSPDSQRYFDYHHANTDVFEAVNRRELELGSAAMATMVYLIDQHGVK
jgi:carboxypeptidase Q